MTGRNLFGQWRMAMSRNGIDLQPWEDLDNESKAAWNELATMVEWREGFSR
jgi:hypothetical protein